MRVNSQTAAHKFFIAIRADENDVTILKEITFGRLVIKVNAPHFRNVIYYRTVFEVADTQAG